MAAKMNIAFIQVLTLIMSISGCAVKRVIFESYQNSNAECIPKLHVNFKKNSSFNMDLTFGDMYSRYSEGQWTIANDTLYLFNSIKNINELFIVNVDSNSSKGVLLNVRDFDGSPMSVYAKIDTLEATAFNESDFIFGQGIVKGSGPILFIGFPLLSRELLTLNINGKRNVNITITPRIKEYKTYDIFDVKKFNYSKNRKELRVVGSEGKKCYLTTTSNKRIIL